MKTRIQNTLAAVQSVSPIGALVIFAAAFIASYVGLAALLIVAALLGGMHFAKRPIAPESTSSVVAASVQGASSPVEVLPALPSSPLADALANGLTIKEIKFSTPAVAKTRKQVVAAV